MHVATCVITLQLNGVGSLKAKRSVLKSILLRVPKRFNVAAAEVDCQDTWNTSVICLVTVGNDTGYLHAILERAVVWIEKSRPDTYIERYSIEFR
jgi:uncharacterized protein YlxP (DUF503 family)